MAEKVNKVVLNFFKRAKPVKPKKAAKKERKKP